MDSLQRASRQQPSRHIHFEPLSDVAEENCFTLDTDMYQIVEGERKVVVVDVTNSSGSVVTTARIEDDILLQDLRSADRTELIVVDDLPLVKAKAQVSSSSGKVPTIVDGGDTSGKKPAAQTSPIIVEDPSWKRTAVGRVVSNVNNGRNRPSTNYSASILIDDSYVRDTVPVVNSRPSVSTNAPDSGSLTTGKATTVVANDALIFVDDASTWKVPSIIDGTPIVLDDASTLNRNEVPVASASDEPILIEDNFVSQVNVPRAVNSAPIELNEKAACSGTLATKSGGSVPVEVSGGVDRTYPKTKTGCEDAPIVIGESSDEEIGARENDQDVLVIESNRKEEAFSSVRHKDKVKSATRKKSDLNIPLRRLSSDYILSQIEAGRYENISAGTQQFSHPTNSQLSSEELLAQLEGIETLVVSADKYDEALLGFDIESYNHEDDHSEILVVDLSTGYKTADNSVQPVEENKTESDSDFEPMDDRNEDVNSSDHKKKSWKFHRYSQQDSEIRDDFCKLCLIDVPPRKFQKHTEFHEEQSTVQCSTCFLFFENMDLLKQHKKSHYKEIEVDPSEFNYGTLESDPSEFNYKSLEKVEYKCFHCGTYFNSENDFYSHQFDVFCEYCKRSIRCSNLMKTHINEKCEAYKNMYLCKFCKKGFKTSSTLSYHLKTTFCKFCKEMYQLKSKSDQLEKAGLVECKCSNCELFLLPDEGVRDHKSLMPCNEVRCTRVFRCRTLFLVHILRDYQFNCSCHRCSAKFSSFGSLMEHNGLCTKNIPKRSSKALARSDKEDFVSDTKIKDTQSEQKREPKKSQRSNKALASTVEEDFDTKIKGAQNEEKHNPEKSGSDGYVTVGTLKKLFQRSRGTMTKFALKLKRMYPDTYGTHTNVTHLVWCIEKTLDKVHRKEVEPEDYFVPKRKKRKIRRYYEW